MWQCCKMLILHLVIFLIFSTKERKCELWYIVYLFSTFSYVILVHSLSLSYRRKKIAAARAVIPTLRNTRHSFLILALTKFYTSCPICRISDLAPSSYPNFESRMSREPRLLNKVHFAFFSLWASARWLWYLALLAASAKS